MSDTKLKAKLPEGEANGLKGDAWRKTLVEAPRRPRVAIVIFDVDSINKTLDDNLEVPSVRLQAIEPVTDEFEEKRLIKQLQKSQAARTGATPLDIPDEEEPRDAGPLAVEAPGGYTFEVRALPAGRIGVYLITATGAEVGKRGALKAEEHGGIIPGSYTRSQLPESLKPVADVLVGEWEVSPENVVDAEVVDDEGDGDDAA